MNISQPTRKEHSSFGPRGAPSFREKVALVTGAGSGIGREVALLLAARGARVAVVGRTASALEATVGMLRAGGADALAIEADVRDEGSIVAAVGRAVSTFGALHVAVSCAGNAAESGSLADLSVDDYARVFDVHVRGTFLTIKHVIPAILASGGGSVTTTASTGGVVGFPGAALYCAAKHAVVGLTKVAALDYAALGIRVNCVAPSAVETPMLDRFTGGSSDIVAALAAAHPMRRIATARDVAECFAWIASDAASYVTGQTVLVDGGYSVG